MAAAVRSFRAYVSPSTNLGSMAPPAGTTDGDVVLVHFASGFPYPERPIRYNTTSMANRGIYPTEALGYLWFIEVSSNPQRICWIDLASWSDSGGGYGYQSLASTSGGHPIMLPDNSKFVVPCTNLDNIQFLDTTTRTLDTPLSCSNYPYYAVAMSDSTKMYVSCIGTTNHTVDVIDLSGPTLDSSIDLGNSTAFPGQMIITDDDNYVWIVSDKTTGTIKQISTSSDTVVDTITMSLSGGTVATVNDVFAMSHDQAYIALAYDNGTASCDLAIFRTSDNTHIQTISIGDGPFQVIWSSDDAYIYVLCTGGINSVWRVDTSPSDGSWTASAWLQVGTGDQFWAFIDMDFIALTSDDSILYVSDLDSWYVYAVSTNTGKILNCWGSLYTPKGIHLRDGDTKAIMFNNSNDIAEIDLTRGWYPLMLIDNFATSRVFWRIADNEPSDYEPIISGLGLGINSALVTMVTISDPLHVPPTSDYFGGTQNTSASATSVAAPATGTFPQSSGIDVWFASIAINTTVDTPTDYTEEVDQSLSTVYTEQFAWRALTDVTGVGAVSTNYGAADYNYGFHVFIPDGVAPVQLKPTADVAVGSWTPTPLYSRIDDDLGSEDGTTIEETS